MEKIPQPQNDIKPEKFLNPKNMPAVPVGDKEKQQETLDVNLDYQMMLAGVMFGKAIRSNMSSEEIDLLATLTRKDFEHADKETVNETVTTEEVYKNEEAENKKEVSLKEGESSKMSVFTRAVELMKDYLEKHPKVAKMLFPAIVASELAGCAGMPMYTAGNMVQTGLYGMQTVAQTGIYGYNQSRQTVAYGQNQAAQTAQYGAFQAQASYDGAMQRAAQNRINTYNSLGSQATAEQTQRIEAQYQNEVNYAQMQAQQIQAQAQAQAQQIAQSAQNQAQQIQMSTQAQQQQIQMSVTGQILQQAIGGIIQGAMHGGWHR